MSASDQHSAPWTRAFRDRLPELGWIDGQNVIVDHRYAEWNEDRLLVLARELVDSPVKLIVAADTQALAAAHKVTQTTPIIMAIGGDVIRQGMAESLARPGGNVTGMTNMAPQLAGKRLEILRDIVPELRRVGVLFNSKVAGVVLQVNETRAAAGTLGIEVISMPIGAADDIDSAFEAASKNNIQALVVLPDSLTNTHRIRLAEAASSRRLPTMGAVRTFAEDGGLLAYGPDRIAFYSRTADFVDKILRGSSPATIPIEQPTRFEFIINLKAAENLGLQIPRHLLLNANEVVR